MKRLAIIGSGDLGQLIAYHAKDSGYLVAGFFDDFKGKGSLMGEFTILGTSEDIENSFSVNEFDVLMIGIGYKHFLQRKFYFEKFRNRIPFATIIHSSCFVSSSCIIKEGTIILPGCTLDRN